MRHGTGHLIPLRCVRMSEHETGGIMMLQKFKYHLDPLGTEREWQDGIKICCCPAAACCAESSAYCV